MQTGKLKILITNLEGKLPYFTALNTNVSSASVGWHIEHSLLTVNQIIESVKHSDPSAYQPKFSIIKLLIFMFEKIPRGKAQSPESVRPSAAFGLEEIKTNLKKCYGLIEIIPSLNKDNFFIHPIFGKLNLKSTVKFIEIHTKHHLHIINDIVNASGKE